MAVESCKLWRILGGRFHASLFRRLRHYFQSMLCTGTCSALDFRGPALVFPPTNGLEAVSALEWFHVFFWLEYGVFSWDLPNLFGTVFGVRASYTFSLATTLPTSGLLASNRCSSLKFFFCANSALSIFGLAQCRMECGMPLACSFRFWIHK